MNSEGRSVGDDVVAILNIEMRRLTDQLKQDLRYDLSRFLRSHTAPAAQPSPAPSSHHSPLPSEIGLMSLRPARSYFVNEGPGHRLPIDQMTLIGTPKGSESSSVSPQHVRRAQSGSAGSSPRKLPPLSSVGQASWTDQIMGTTSPLDSMLQSGEDNPRPDSPEHTAETPRSKKEKARITIRDRLRAPKTIFQHSEERRGSVKMAGDADGKEEEVDPSSPFSTVSRASRCVWRSVRSSVRWLVDLEYFDYFMGAAILVNAALMGAQADYAVRSARTGEAEPPELWVLGMVLGLLFTVELLLRITATGLGFFIGDGWQWNIFDFLLVALQIGEELITGVTAATVKTSSSGASVNLSFMRVLRILRLVRIIRLVRVLRLIRELRTLVHSIASTMTSLFWTVALLMLLMLVVGIAVTQVAADVGLEMPDALAEDTAAYEYYGSLGRSILSLFQSITNGVSWKELCDPLAKHTPIIVVLWSTYIAFAMLAMLNVITGVFVESAMASASEENNLDMANRLWEVVDAMNVGKNGGRMTFDMLKDQLSNPMFEEYFKSVDLSISEAKFLFNLLDFGQEGSIDPQDFVEGCCRIHGPAKAIDLTTLMSEITHLHRQWGEHAVRVEEILTLGASAASPTFPSPFRGHAGAGVFAAAAGSSPKRQPQLRTNAPTPFSFQMQGTIDEAMQEEEEDEKQEQEDVQDAAVALSLQELQDVYAKKTLSLQDRKAKLGVMDLGSPAIPMGVLPSWQGEADSETLGGSRLRL